jgi:hypothetical protein
VPLRGPLRTPALDPLSHRDQVARDPIHQRHLRLKLGLKDHLRPQQVLSEAGPDCPLRPLCRLDHLHNPTQRGFGRFEQLAEHL